METVVVVFIVVAAVAWAGRESWRALRPKRPTSSCGCPSAGRCAVARDCSQAASPAPVSPDTRPENRAPGSPDDSLPCHDRAQHDADSIQYTEYKKAGDKHK